MVEMASGCGWVMDLAAVSTFSFRCQTRGMGSGQHDLFCHIRSDTLRREWLQQCVRACANGKEIQHWDGCRHIHCVFQLVDHRWFSPEKPKSLVSCLRYCGLSQSLSVYIPVLRVRGSPFCTPEFSISISDSWLNFMFVAWGVYPTSN